jgi:uncharacterized membrane protein YbhN (UPF0104 family)
MKISGFFKGEDSPKSSIKWLKVAGFSAVVMVIAWWLPRFDLQSVSAALLAADFSLISICLLMVLIFWCLRGYMLWLIMCVGGQLGWGLVMMANFVGGMTDQIFPGRTGYVVRWGILSFRSDLTKSFVFSALSASVLVEGLVLIGLFFLSFALSQHIPAPLSARVVAGMGFGTLLLLLGLLFSHKIEHLFSKTVLNKVNPLMALVRIAHKIKEPKAIAWMSVSLVAWCVEIGIAMLAAQAFHFELSISQAVLLVLCINIGIAVPVSPGNIGTLQLIITTVITQMGVDPATALAYSIGFHAIHLVPLFVGGIISASILGLRPVEATN